MEDPRTLPLPEEPFQRAIAFARELAYGAFEGEWGVSFWVSRMFMGDLVEQWSTDAEPAADQRLSDYIETRWADNAPSVRLLELLGYLTLHTAHSKETSVYMLTQKAVALLRAPAVMPTVFISYARDQSSAFALLIESRLAAYHIKSFLDKQIEGGAEWEEMIRQTITHKISHLIAVIAPATLDSANVRNELHWALDANVHLIPIWHGGFQGTEAELQAYDETIRAFTRRTNALRVLEESAASYDAVITQLLNQLEFAAAPEEPGAFPG